VEFAARKLRVAFAEDVTDGYVQAVIFTTGFVSDAQEVLENLVKSIEAQQVKRFHHALLRSVLSNALSEGPQLLLV
jgi:hypothetical protein